MFNRTAAVIVAASLLIPPLPARAANPMGYRLLSAQEAASLPRNQGALGLDVERAQQINDAGMTFDIIRVKQVKRQSAGAQAGLKTGDQIIALDGRVFPTLAAFAAYIGSASPGSQMMVDYMPLGAGPRDAQRITVTVGRAGQNAMARDQPDPQQSAGMSTGTKIAIGAGAVALLGCYEMGCFSHRGTSAKAQQPVPQPNGPPANSRQPQQSQSQ
jgi:hypothetical protein